MWEFNTVVLALSLLPLLTLSVFMIMCLCVDQKREVKPERSCEQKHHQSAPFLSSSLPHHHHHHLSLPPHHSVCLSSSPSLSLRSLITLSCFISSSLITLVSPFVFLLLVFHPSSFFSSLVSFVIPSEASFQTILCSFFSVFLIIQFLTFQQLWMRMFYPKINSFCERIFRMCCRFTDLSDSLWEFRCFKNLEAVWIRCRYFTGWFKWITAITLVFYLANTFLVEILLERCHSQYGSVTELDPEASAHSRLSKHSCSEEPHQVWTMWEREAAKRDVQVF